MIRESSEMLLYRHRLFFGFTGAIALMIFNQCFAPAIAFAQAPPVAAVIARPIIPPIAPAEITISFTEQFANSFLDALFTNLKPPAFPLGADNKPEQSLRKSANAFSASGVSACVSEVVLQREVDSVRTAIHFTNKGIVAPLAFTGTYNTGLLGCVRFRGWANASINLEYDRQSQSLLARVAVQDFHLSDLSTRASGVVKELVQSAINKRVNPIKILQAAQLAARLPVTAAGGALRLRVTDLRPEVLQNELRLHLFYEFVSGD
jgi:hypothetical protein